MENVNDIKWLGNAGFYFKDPGSGMVTYYVDPFSLKQKTLPKGDLIFITHAHSDHFSVNDINSIAKDNSFIFLPHDCIDKLDWKYERKISVKPGDSVNFRPGFSFKTIPAYNNKPERINFHPKKNDWVGYIFEFGKTKIYHAGDTDFIEEMKALKDLNLDVAMLPIGGTYTMDTEEAALAANAICAKVTVPMHYKNQIGPDYKEAEEKFKNLVTNSKVVILEELK